MDDLTIDDAKTILAYCKEIDEGEES